ncbi:carbohydrate-binding protein, partial [Pelagicoccus enzymogenes]|nr:carbohydrate-binding protein [Pelagicoccus enzymogenes]
MPILVNADANEVEEDNWLVENMLMIGTKQGFFSHGYQINHGIEFLDKFRALEAKARAHNPPLEVFTRGEMDAEILDFAWGTNNLEQALYWSGLYATHCQLDSWNVRSDLLQDPIHFETCEFFNRYAGLHRAENSPRAVIALRDGLDSADLTRFPEGQFGTGLATRGNLSRYQDIIAAFSGRGARLDDTVAVTKSAFASRRTDGYNDVGWKIIPGNFERFITQINPLSGDKGWWNVDVVKKGSPLGQASKYSRFARGFDGAGGGMYFDIADDLADNLHPNRSLVKVRIIYFDEHAGSTWQLRYDSGATGMKVRNFTNTGDLEWKEVVVTLIDADFQGNGTFGADIELINTDAFEDIFHRIEVEYPSVNVSTGSDLDVLLDATLYDAESDPADATVIEDLGDRVGSIKNASWVRYDRVDLGTGAPAFEVSVSSASSGGTIDVWFGDFEAGQGGVISTVHTVGTGSWSNFQTFSASVSGGVGIDDLYLVFSGSDGDLFELQSFKFSTSGSGSPGSVTLSSSVSGSDVTLTASASDPDGVASVNF